MNTCLSFSLYMFYSNVEQVAGYDEPVTNFTEPIILYI